MIGWHFSQKVNVSIKINSIYKSPKISNSRCIVVVTFVMHIQAKPMWKNHKILFVDIKKLTREIFGYTWPLF